MNDEKSGYELWAKEYGLRFEPNYSAFTEADCKAAWQASAAHSAARIAELEWRVAMLLDAFSVYPDVSQLLNVLEQEWRQQGAWSDWDESTVTEFRRLGVIISATARTAEQYRRRVQAEALEEAAKTLGQERNYGVDPYSKILSMASELRNSANQAEGKGEK